LKREFRLNKLQSLDPHSQKHAIKC